MAVRRRDVIKLDLKDIHPLPNTISRSVLPLCYSIDTQIWGHRDTYSSVHGGLQLTANQVAIDSIWKSQVVVVPTFFSRFDWPAICMYNEASCLYECRSSLHVLYQPLHIDNAGICISALCCGCARRVTRQQATYCPVLCRHLYETLPTEKPSWSKRETCS